MTAGPTRAVTTNLGPLTGALPSSQNTTLTAQGIGNWTSAGFSATQKFIGGNGDPNAVFRVKLVCKTAGVDLAWKTVVVGASAPTVTAAGAGGANEGTLLCGGSGATEEFSITGAEDLYVCPSAAAVAQVTLWVQ